MSNNSFAVAARSVCLTATHGVHTASCRLLRSCIFGIGLVQFLTIVPSETVAQERHENAPHAVYERGIRSCDEIFIVSTRPIGCRYDDGSLREGLDIREYAVGANGRRRWFHSNLERVTSGSSNRATLIFVHGNRVENSEDESDGVFTYRRVMASAYDAAPIRFVIFSWPSGEVGGPLRDVRVKAARTRPVAAQMVWLLDQYPSDTRIGLIGYSYGARIITGALHLRGGGSLSGITRTGCAHGCLCQSVRVALVAAALDSHWLGPGQYHEMAMSQVDEMLLINSRTDRIMRFYHLSSASGHPQAMGLKGPTCLAPGDRARICQRDVARSTGPSHDLARYLCVAGVGRQIRETVSHP